MVAESHHNQILNKIKAGKRGNIIFPSDFLRISPETATRQSLSRLTKEGILKRLGNGIYLYPKIDKELGVLYPSMEDIAVEIAKKNRVKLLPTGSYALNKLGLSTQVPTKLVYLTNGEAKLIKLGRNTIRFKSSTPKKLAAKGKYSSLVIQALQELGQRNIDAKVLKRVDEVLQQEDPAILFSDAKTAPSWAAKILLNTLKKNKQ